MESIGNSLESVLRARCVNKRLTDSYSHPSELKSAIKVGKGKGSGGADSNGKQPDHHLSNYSHQKQIFSNYHSNDDEKTKIDRFSPEKGAEMHDLKNVDNEAGVEYKSTYPIDEPVDSGSGSVLNAHQFSEDGYCENNVRRSPLSHERHLPHNHSRSETFPVDEKCCDVNEPCEEHAQDYLGGDSLDLSDENFLNGEHQRQQFATLHYSGYNDKVSCLFGYKCLYYVTKSKRVLLFLILIILQEYLLCFISIFIRCIRNQFDISCGFIYYVIV